MTSTAAGLLISRCAAAGRNTSESSPRSASTGQVILPEIIPDIGGHGFEDLRFELGVAFENRGTLVLFEEPALQVGLHEFGRPALEDPPAGQKKPQGLGLPFEYPPAPAGEDRTRYPALHPEKPHAGAAPRAGAAAAGPGR